MYTLVTRTAGIMLAFGLFFGCSSSISEIYQARNNLEKQEYEKALKSVNKEIQSNPSNAEAYYLKGNILFEMALNRKNPSIRTPLYKDMRKALKTSQSLYLDSVSAQNSVELQNIRDLLKNGWTNEYREGLTLFKRDTSTNNPVTDQALAHFNNAIILIPDSTQPYRNKARILYKNGQTESAISTLESVLKIHKTPSPSVLEQLAFLYLEDGKTDRAIALYEEAMKQNENNTNLKHGLVNAYIRNKAHHKAVKVLDTLINQYPQNPSYRLSLGSELYHLASAQLDSIPYQKLSEANAANDSSWQSNTPLPSDLQKEVFNHWHRTDSLFKEARIHLQKADSLNPDVAQYDHALAMLYKNIAIDYRSASSYLPGDLRKHAEKQVQKYFRTAINHLEKAVKQNPDNSKYWSNLYQLYSHLGMNDKAERARKKSNL